MSTYPNQRFAGGSGLHKRAAFVGRLASGLALGLLLVPGTALARAAEPALPAPLCALVSQQLICYDVQTAAPTLISPQGQYVTDYAFAPDGNWLVYRVDSSITLIAASGTGASQTIDSDAEPPPTSDPAWTTMAWSPDALAVAYVTAGGLRVAFPPAKTGDSPRYANAADRPYINLRFSPTGQRLAAQADDGSWTIFDVSASQATLQASRSIDQASDAAWLDDASLVVAPISGGLLQLDAAGDAAPKWSVPNDHFTKLFTTSSGQVLATHPAPGDTMGAAVSISADGKVTSLGTAKIDSRVVWGPDGRMMLYITSGTPILVNRATGDEDTLPVRGVTQVTWAPPPPSATTSLPLDGDLYFLAANGANNSQVWRLVRSGTQTVTQVTQGSNKVLDYAVSPDRNLIALTTGGELVLTSLATPNSNLNVVLATLNDSTQGFEAAQPDWRPDGQQIAYRDSNGVYLVDVNASDIAALSHTPTPQATQSRASGRATVSPTATPTQIPVVQNPIYQKGVFAVPRYSSDGRFLLMQGDSLDAPLFYIGDLQNKRSQLIAIPAASDHEAWGHGASLIGYSTENSRENGGLAVVPFTTNPGNDTQPPTSIFTADSTWRIADAHFITDTSFAFLREVGWSAGPDVVQLYSVAIPGGASQPQGTAVAIPQAQLSPSGQFAAGIQRVGKIEVLVIADLRTGRKYRIQGIADITALTWVR